jgi:hypothetical protein
MFRTTLSWALVAILYAVAGCRMCSHPYDYCGPVYDRGCQSCCPPERAGSVLEATAQPSPEAAQGPDAAPGSERVISTTEQAAEPSAGGQPTQTAGESSVDSDKHSSDGWTARRPANRSGF